MQTSSCALPNRRRARRQIDRFFAEAIDKAKRLWPAIRDLAAGFSNLFSALDRTGIVDQSIRGFRSLAASFRRATEEGGGLDDFLKDVRELMPFIGEAARKVGSAIAGIADAVISAREKGSKLTILQGIFRGIGNAAKPLKNFVIGTFRALGPAIADLMPSLSRFLESFGAGTVTGIKGFVDTLTRAVRWFNRLPEPVKRAAGQLAALSLILKGFGIAALVAPMGKFAGKLLAVGGASKGLNGKSGLKGVAASLGAFALKGGVIGAAILGVGAACRSLPHSLPAKRADQDCG